MLKGAARVERAVVDLEAAGGGYWGVKLRWMLVAFGQDRICLLSF